MGVLAGIKAHHAIANSEGDIEGGTSTYVLGLAGTLPLILLTYIFPITLGFLVYPQRELWQVHAFTDIAFSFTPSLGLSMVAASALSHFGKMTIRSLHVQDSTTPTWHLPPGKFGPWVEGKIPRLRWTDIFHHFSAKPQPMEFLTSQFWVLPPFLLVREWVR